MKQLEAESTQVHQASFQLVMCLKTLLSHWSDASVRIFGWGVDCLFDTVNEEKLCHTN